MDHFINSMINRGDFSSFQKHLMILDGHKSHITLGVLQKARMCGLDTISLPSHTNHALQPLDMACFGPFKKAFRAYRDLWMMQGNTKKVGKKNLAQWASLALKKALTPNNIRARFKGCGIWPLNFVAMEAKMGPSKGFPSRPRTPIQNDILIQKIMDEGLPSLQKGVVHYFIDDGSSGDELPQSPSTHEKPLEEDEIGNPNLFTTFLRLLQETPKIKKTICEPLVDYSQSQIFTSIEHVQKLKDIASKRHQVQKEKEERAKVKELTKNERLEERLKKVVEKNARTVAKEAKKKFNMKWTKDAIEEVGEKLH